MKNLTIEKLQVTIAPDSEEMGQMAASEIAKELIRLGRTKNNVRVMFAAAPSQDTTLSALLQIEDIPWDKIDAFHMDEYVGITSDKPQSFRNYLDRMIFSHRKFHSINLIQGDVPDAENEARRYEKLLKESPLDLIVLGIGENGHIAFNDPPDADFDDPYYAKVIQLSERSRLQQVHDGCFSKLEDVPKQAITVTIPAFKTAGALFCVVPNSRKADAVRKTLDGPITDSCPASILRNHDKAHLFLDVQSASLL